MMWACVHSQALQSEGSSTGDANSVVLEESSSTPSAGKPVC